MLKIIRRVLLLSGDLSKRIYGSFVCSFLDAVIAMLPMGAVFYVLIRLQDGAVMTQNDWLLVIVLLAVSLLGRMVFKYLVYRLQSTAGFEFVARERVTMGDRLRDVPMGFFHDNSLGSITATVTTDLNFLENYSMHILDRITTGIISMVVMGIFILLFDVRLGGIFLLGVLCSFIVYAQMQKKGSALAAKQRQVQADSVQATLEYVQGISVIKAFNMSGKKLGGIEAAYEKSADAAIAIERTFAPLHMSYAMVFRVSACVIMFVAQLIAIYEGLSFPDLAVILIASFSIFNAIEVMGQMTTMIRMMDVSLDRVEQIKNAKPIDENGKNMAPHTFDIEFDRVRFSYDKEAPVLKDVSFTIPQGKMTAVVGPSGSGKTTVTRLIARFWDVQSGSITIGGQDIRTLTCDSLMKNISMVFQNVYLFRDTIRNNIKLGCPDASDAQMIEAAQRAHCHAFISALPDGYDTVIGEGGSTLSGGEKQRISIARAMLKDAPIILLDEATASVDPENELYLQRAIAALVQDKTLIVIAHRLSTIQNADQILVLDAGHIVQRGRHEDLIAQDGLYRSFWNIRQRAKEWKLTK